MKLSTLKDIFSSERLLPYQNYVQQMTMDNVDEKTVELYAWNIKISSAFLELTQYYEVALRNAILKAIEEKYYTYGIQDRSFIRSLPSNSKKELNSLISGLKEDIKKEKIENKEPFDDIVLSNGKIVSCLNFYFWETILKYMICLNCNKSKNNNHSYPLLYNNRTKFSQTATDDDISKIVDITNNFRNKIRNRICHHEPIYKNNLAEIYNDIMWCINHISPNLHDFIKNNLNIVELLENKPV